MQNGAGPDVVPMAVRVWTVRTPPPAKAETAQDANADPVDEPPAWFRKRRYPAEVLVFDTETLNGAGQQLMVGVWRLYRTDPDAPAGQVTCIEEGFFYPDDLPDRDPTGWAALRVYVDSQHADVAPGFGPELQLHPVSWWLDQRLYLYGWRHSNRCDIVGFNLPFDLGALARYWAPARGKHRGGWSLGLWGYFDTDGRWKDARYRRRLLIRAIDPRRSLFAWGSNSDADAPDLQRKRRFIDLRTLAFALTDRSYTLEAACTAFGDPFEKQDVTYGVIDEAMLHYAREDVRHTAILYRNCLTELARHKGVDLAPHALYSPAGIGAAYLRAMNVTPPLEKFTDLDPQLLGWSMSAFFGGRAEARIVRTPVPVVVADFTSMYPAQNALLDTWPLLTAASLTVDDVTDSVRRLVAAPDLLDRLFDPQMWREHIGVTLVQLDHPDGVLLPVRAGYEPGARDYGIGVNPLTYDGTLWYALPDVLAAALLGTAAIPISRALRLRPGRRQRGLKPVHLRGHREVDPRQRANPFVAMIEERHRVKHATDLPAEERNRLDLFLKITANATAYGSLARFDRRDEGDPVSVTVYGPRDEGFPDRTRYPEDPGPYCFPPVAASITAGARLMLALIERVLSDTGGSYAFMDTDSIAIVATEGGGQIPCDTADGDTVTAISHEQVRNLLRRFEPLNPYGPDVVNDDPALGRSPWKVEHDSLRRPVWCYAIATKRYALYRPSTTGPQLVDVGDGHEESAAAAEAGDSAAPDRFADWSEHGLGVYLDPTDERERDNNGRRLWVRDAWSWILNSALGEKQPLPIWHDRYAITQFSISGPQQASWFRLDDIAGSRGGKPRPFGFGILAQASTGLADATPAAPYDKEAAHWPKLSWYDRLTGNPIRTISDADLSDDPDLLASTITDGQVPVRSIGHAVTRYLWRPEHKSLTVAGAWAEEDTQGQLIRRPITSVWPLTTLIGKEGNRLLERATGETTDPEQYRNSYGDQDSRRWFDLVLPVVTELRDLLGTEELSHDLGVSGRTIRNWINSNELPHAGATQNRQRVERYATDWARRQLERRGLRPPSDAYAALHAVLVVLRINGA